MHLTYRQIRRFLYDSYIHGDAVAEFPEDVVLFLLHAGANHLTELEGQVLFGELPDDLDVPVPLPRAANLRDFVVRKLFHVLLNL